MDRPLYVMDDEYIEEKYVRAEEERQKREEEERLRRKREEAEALEQAEQQRKRAEAERQRRKAEEEHAQRLEAAKRQREEEEKRRKQQESAFQSQLDQIEDELLALETEKSKFLTEKLDMSKRLKQEEDDAAEPIKDLQQQMDDLAAKMEILKAQQKEVEAKGRKERAQFENREKVTVSRIKELTDERRKIQRDMLDFLQQPYRNETFSITPSAVPSPAAFTTNAEVGYPSVEIQTTPQPASSSSNGITDQIALLDEFLQSGVLTRDEYEDAKRKVYEDAGRTNASAPASAPPPAAAPTPARQTYPIAHPVYNSSPAKNVQVNAPPSGIDAQLQQLNEFRAAGVLSEEEYNDARDKVLEDAGLRSKPSTPSVAPAHKTAAVTVTVPPGLRPGEMMQIEYERRWYNVVIPPGVTAGKKFVANINQ